jgi:hypothetical protein
MTLLENLQDFFRKDRQKLTYLTIAPSHVKGAYSSEPVRAGGAYFRIVLSEAFLKQRKALFTTLHPAVHSVVKLTFGDEVVEIPAIADTTKIVPQAKPSGDVVMRNYPLTPRMPFNGGTVELAAGLIALEGQNHLQSFMKVMGDFAGVLTVPQLSGVLALAAPLAQGIQDLFASGTIGLHLGLFDSFEGQVDADNEVINYLRGGFLAVIRKPEVEVNVDELWVVDGTLRVGPSMDDNQPYEEVDHVLFQVITLTERDDWDALTTIREARSKLREALNDAAAEPDEPLFVSRAKKALALARLAVKESPDLTKADRRRITERLNQEYREGMEEITGLGLIPKGALTLGDMMQGAMSVDQALELGEPTLDEVWED